MELAKTRLPKETGGMELGPEGTAVPPLGGWDYTALRLGERTWVGRVEGIHTTADEACDGRLRHNQGLANSYCDTSWGAAACKLLLRHLLGRSGFAKEGASSCPVSSL